MSEASAKIHAPRRAGPPAHQQVYETLRTRVLFGELPPGSAVTIQGIADSLGAGLTPVREALRRLIAEGALHHQDNRRVSVPVLSQAEIEDIAHLRLAVEPELAKRAAAHVQKADLAVLAAIDADLDVALAQGNVAGYLVQNHAFHSRLNALAAAPVLSDVAERLWLRFGPSMRVVCSAQGTTGLPDLHKDVLTALANRDGAAAAQALAADIQQGTDHLIAALTWPVAAQA